MTEAVCTDFIDPRSGRFWHIDIARDYSTDLPYFYLTINGETTSITWNDLNVNGELSLNFLNNATRNHTDAHLMASRIRLIQFIRDESRSLTFVDPELELTIKFLNREDARKIRGIMQVLGMLEVK